MAQFSKVSFDVAGYLASRPQYPQRLYDMITAYHTHNNTGGTRQALDLGCGPGFMALALAPKFETTTGLDPSKKMVSVGVQPSDKSKHITYAVGSAEDLGALAPQSIDLVVAGQAAHWFDHQTAWAQIGRVLRPGGTVAYVGYGEIFFPSNSALNPLISAHQGGVDALGPHWSQPGRRIVEGLLDAVPFPVAPALTPNTSEVLSRLPNLYDDGGYPVPDLISEPAPTSGSSGWNAESAVRLKRDSTGRQYLLRPQGKWGWKSLEAYMRTASALHAYHEKYPEDKARIGGGANGDIVDRLVAKLKAELKKTGNTADEVEVAWPLVLMMIKKDI